MYGAREEKINLLEISLNRVMDNATAKYLDVVMSRLEFYGTRLDAECHVQQCNRSTFSNFYCHYLCVFIRIIRFPYSVIL